MKVQWQILIFMACLNLSTGLVIELSLAGTEYVQPTNPSNVTEYSEHFNATEVADAWESTPFSGIPVVGDIFSGFQFLWRNVAYLIAGFPLFLSWIGTSFIVEQSALNAYNAVIAVLYALFSIVMSAFVIEFISGRYVSD